MTGGYRDDSNLGFAPDGTIRPGAPLDLLRGISRPGSLLDRIAALEREVAVLRHLGVPRSDPSRVITIGSQTDSIDIKGKLTVNGQVLVDPEGESGPTSLTTLLTGPDQMLRSSPAGAQEAFTVGNNRIVGNVGGVTDINVPANSWVGRSGGATAGNTVATNEVVGRAGGNLGAIAVAASQLFGRTAAGNLAGLSVSDVIGMFNTAGWPITSVKTGTTYSATVADFLIPVNPGTGDLVITLPTNPGVANIKIIFDVDAGIGAGETLEIAPGTASDTINGAAASWGPNATSLQTIICIFEPTTRDWAIRRFVPFST